MRTGLDLTNTCHRATNVPNEQTSNIRGEEPHVGKRFRAICGAMTSVVTTAVFPASSGSNDGAFSRGKYACNIHKA